MFPTVIAPNEQEEPQMNGIAVHKQYLLQFRLWMAVLSLIFLITSISMLYYFESILRPRQRQSEILTDWSMTMTLGYAYARMLMHIGTKRLLHQQSHTFNLLCPPMQDDCAYILVDTLSAFFWNPLIMYGCCQVFKIGDMHIFFRECGPFAKVTLTMFQIDRAMQLVVHFRMERLVHHSLTAMWSLFIVEWSCSLRDPGVFVTGAILEGLGKFSWYFHFLARMNRAFIRHQQPGEEWNAEAILGVDTLFVAKSAAQQTRMMQVGFVIFLLAHLVIPFSLVVAFLTTQWESVQLFWKIALPCMMAIFNVLDKSQYRTLYKQSKLSYWIDGVFQNKREKTKDNMMKNNRRGTTKAIGNPFGNEQRTDSTLTTEGDPGAIATDV